jgi:hypothetical protein
VFSDADVDVDVERALAENISVEEFDQILADRRSLFFQMLLVWSVLVGILLGSMTEWFNKLFFAVIAFGICFGLQLVLIILVKVGCLSSRFVSIMCAVNAGVAVFVSASVSGAPFVFVWHVGTTPFLALMLGAIAGINYAWIFFAVMLGFSIILPKDIVGFGKPMLDMEFLLKVTSVMPVVTCGICLLLMSRMVADSARRRKMNERMFERLSRQKDMFVANLSHEVFGPPVCQLCCSHSVLFEQIRTPLHGLLGSAEMLKSDRHLSPAASENVDAILHCSSALRLLIENVLAVGREGGLATTEVTLQMNLGFKLYLT